ncbi:MAG: pyridoxamine 5'-phosphate oxidase family protein [Clostridia bacterium]|nr:pyridoxamine 5'-phosphate oxidase family protein [Clostridia bacterium]
MLNIQQIKNIQTAEKVIFTTSDKNYQPRSIWVIPSRIEKDRIILSNIQMNRTFENIKQNSKCFINVLLPEQDDLQYKIEGVAEIFDKGELFKEIKNFEESENLPPELKVNSIIVIDLISFEQTNG